MTEIVQIRKCWALEINHWLYLDITNILLVFPKIRGFRYNEQIFSSPFALR